MRDVLPELLAWWRSGADTVLATVVGAWQSAPRPPGARRVEVLAFAYVQPEP